MFGPKVALEIGTIQALIIPDIPHAVRGTDDSLFVRTEERKHRLVYRKPDHELPTPNDLVLR